MKLQAYPRTIKDILTLNRKYEIPRFQREFSWEDTEYEVFWNDIINQIKNEKNILNTTDYFIGSLVLVGDDANTKSNLFQIVDGQQRITTITIILSALSTIFLEIKEEDLSKSCYAYIEGKDDDYKPFFKLVNENPKPFFQKRIQNLIKEQKEKPASIEEERLLECYNYFLLKLEKNNLLKIFVNIDYITILKTIRDQILKFNTVFITVPDIKYAYTIFETLNAKGKDLEVIDLIKNKIFQFLDQEHPSDDAKDKWKKIKNTLNSRTSFNDISTFFRHFWISKYEFLTENRIYDSFLKKIEINKNSYNSFIDDIVQSANDYNLITNPSLTDWKSADQKEIYFSLNALKIFNVTQPNSLLLTLFDLKRIKKININHFIEIVKTIENFHFIFTAICSSRASGLEGKYSTISRNLRQAKDTKEALKILNELTKFFISKISSKEVFENSFIKLEYLDEKTKDKKIIQYIFSKIEKFKQNTNELIPNNLSLEHILPQSENSIYKGLIGNLLPLSNKINEEAQNYKLEKKIPIYEKSEFKIVKEFVLTNKTKTNWTDDDIKKRTKELANLCYDAIWSIKI